MHKPIQRTPRMRPVALAIVFAAAALAACDKPSDSKTAGQRMDNATARAEQKANQAKESAKS